MTSTLRLGAGLAALTLFGLALAQAAPPPAAPAAAASAPAAPAKARPHIVIIEDDGVRIEEVHLRGAVRSITVQSKVGGVRPYQVLVSPPGRDPSQERGNAGRRAWSLFDF